MGEYKEIEHDADIGLEVSGADLPDLFKTAALGMFSLLVEKETNGGTGGVTFPLELDGSCREDLLVAFLSELLYKFESEETIPLEIEFENLDEVNLRARITGRTRAAEERLLADIKSVTYHNLEIEQTPEGFHTVIILDV